MNYSRLKITRRDAAGYLFIAPAILFLFAITIYPMIRVFWNSLFDFSMGTYGGKFVGFAHYLALFKDPLLRLSLRNTVVFSIGAVCLHLILGLSLAVLLNKKFGHRNTLVQNVFRGFFLQPWLFSSAVAGALWTLMYHPFGVLNSALRGLGVAPISFLGDTRFAMWSVIAVNAWKFFPFTMVMILAGLQSIPHELHEASSIDGASRSQQFRFVTLPLLMPVVSILTTLDFIWSFGSFDLVWLLTRGGPMDATEVLATYSYKTAFLGLDFGYASSISVVIFIVHLVLAVLYLRLYRKNVGVN
jgi:multiple sugar transport system permease protein